MRRRLLAGFMTGLLVFTQAAPLYAEEEPVTWYEEGESGAEELSYKEDPSEEDLSYEEDAYERDGASYEEDASYEEETFYEDLSYDEDSIIEETSYEEDEAVPGEEEREYADEDDDTAVIDWQEEDLPDGAADEPDPAEEMEVEISDEAVLAAEELSFAGEYDAEGQTRTSDVQKAQSLRRT